VTSSAVPTEIAVIGDRDTGFVSHRELDATLARLPDDVHAHWRPTGAQDAADLDGCDGVWIAPGGPYRDDDAVLAAITQARRRGRPLLATCSGFQAVARELARGLAGVDARHAELDPDAPAPFITALACRLDGVLRPVRCVPGSRLAGLLGTEPFPATHFCGYGLREDAAAVLERAGVRVAAHAPDAGVEALELPGHPFFVATLFQPQIGALAGEPRSPLIDAFVAAARLSGRSGGG
jgi:CTP synthase (UTP-ammonia lyase)